MYTIRVRSKLKRPTNRDLIDKEGTGHPIDKYLFHKTHTHTHTRHTFVPSSNDLSSSNFEREWTTTIPRRIEFLDGIKVIQPSCIMCRDSHASFGNFASTFLGDFVSKSRFGRCKIRMVTIRKGRLQWARCCNYSNSSRRGGSYDLLSKGSTIDISIRFHRKGKGRDLADKCCHHGNG